jgi:hypothetical protein
MPKKSKEKYIEIKPRRGRPPGSKNKNKISSNKKIVLIKEAKKGAKKNTSKSPVPKIEEKVDKLAKFRTKRVKPLTAAEIKTEAAKLDAQNKTNIEDSELSNHILFRAVKWISQYMHPSEVQYYKSDARKRNMPFINCMVSDMLGFFNVKETDLNKYIKSNKFIINYTNTHGLHK